MTIDDEEIARLKRPERLRLSVLSGFVGEVTQNLGAVSASFDGTLIHLSAYFFNEPSEEDREHIELVGTYVIADYPEPFTIETHFLLLSQRPLKGIPWLFLRAEAER